MTRSLPFAFGLCLLSSCVTGCADDENGTVFLSTWGEEFIERGIPREEFEDRYEVEFDTFLITLGDLDARGTAGELRDERTWLVDLTTPGPHDLALHAVANGEYGEVSYRVRPIDADTIVHGSATEEARERMLEGPYSILVEGSAYSSGKSFAFSWAFDTSTLYQRCRQVIDEETTVFGFSVGTGKMTTLELTIHGDHLFYDDLAADDAGLRFEAFAAADADEDGQITLEELAAVPLIDLPADLYGTGNYSDVNDLAAYVRALTTTLGHFNGEGHCQPR